MSLATATAHEPLPVQQEMGLRDYMDILRRRKAAAIQVFVLVMAIGVVVTLLSKPIYATRGKLVIPRVAQTVTMNSGQDPFNRVMNQPDDLPTQIQTLQSGPFIQEAIKEAKIGPRPGVMFPDVRVEQVEGGGNVIQISAEGGDPKEAAALVNAMLDLHINKSKSVNTEGLSTNVDMVRNEKEKQQQALVDAENRLIIFNKQHQVAKATAEQKAKVEEYVDLQSSVTAAESDVTSTQAEVASLQTALQQTPMEFLDKSSKPNTRKEKLQERLSDLEQQRDELLQLYQPTSRQVKSVLGMISSLQAKIAAEPDELETRTHRPNPDRAQLQSEVATQRAKLRGQVARLNAARARFNSRRDLVDQLGPFEIEQARLTRERDMAQAAYTSLSEQLRNLEIRLSVEKNYSPARVLEHARVPGAPIAPRKATNIMLSFFLALAAACGMAFLQEYLDDRVNSPDDLERIAALPTLGHVPLMGPDQPRLVHSLPANSHVAESYRALRSSIGFASIDEPLRRLQVTSASKGEGKTVTSINLATAMAMDGKRVILVDADLRRPTIHRVLNLPNSPGLTEVLLGLKTVDEAIQATDIENLRVVCSGPIPPNPAELLGTRAFDHVIEQLEERADIVIFDTPPCMPVTDPLIVASRMDGVVLVLHVGKTKKGMIKHVQEMLSRARARVVGVIFNQVEHSKGGYYYYHYYYYYGDGYYSEGARRGERHRRNGRGSRRELESGRGALTVGSRVVDSDEDE